MQYYKTEQKRALLEYLKANSEHSFTIDELAERMSKDRTLEVIPGKSTIYRLMSNFVKDGIVKRFVRGNSRQFLYQMVCGEQCDCHLHMKCSSCGKLIHMEYEESEKILINVLKNHNFSIDEETTILFGHCEKCK